MRAFIDTNVLIYWVDDSTRADTVEKLLAGDSVISVQVLNEFANVLRRKRAMPLADVKVLCDTLIDTCEVHDLSVRTHQAALALMAKYSLSLFDANVVAAAILSGCEVLYSEDMQDGLNIRLSAPGSTSTLSIRNPFPG
jgi:predicted nucleic acid-binding protein